MSNTIQILTKENVVQFRDLLIKKIDELECSECNDEKCDRCKKFIYDTLTRLADSACSRKEAEFVVNRYNNMQNNQYGLASKLFDLEKKLNHGGNNNENGSTGQSQ